MDTEGAVREAIREHNREIVVEAAACAAVGAVGTFVTALALGFVMLRTTGSTTPWGWLITTLIVCGVLFVIGALSAWRRGGMRGATERFDDWVANDPLAYMPITLADDYMAAHILAWAIHGPYTLVEAWSMLRSRLPVDEGTVMAAARLLRKLGEDVTVPVAQVLPPRVAFVLLQAGLAKPDRMNPRPPSVLITEKGRDVVLGRVSGSRG